MKTFLTIFGLVVILFQTCRCDSLDISDDCLACICEASTKCNLKFGCRADLGVCGPFQMTLPFWQEGGMNRPIGAESDAKAYEDCATNLFCASQSVRGYAKKFSKDCNGNGKFDCDDYARIHRVGPADCGKEDILKMRFYKAFISSCENPTGFL